MCLHKSGPPPPYSSDEYVWVTEYKWRIAWSEISTVGRLANLESHIFRDKSDLFIHGLLFVRGYLLWLIPYLSVGSEFHWNDYIIQVRWSYSRNWWSVVCLLQLTWLAINCSAVDVNCDISLPALNWWDLLICLPCLDYFNITFMFKVMLLSYTNSSTNG